MIKFILLYIIGGLLCTRLWWISSCRFMRRNYSERIVTVLLLWPLWLPIHLLAMLGALIRYVYDGCLWWEKL